MLLHLPCFLSTSFRLHYSMERGQHLVGEGDEMARLARGIEKQGWSRSEALDQARDSLRWCERWELIIRTVLVLGAIGANRQTTIPLHQ